MEPWLEQGLWQEISPLTAELFKIWAWPWSRPRPAHYHLQAAAISVYTTYPNSAWTDSEFKLYITLDTEARRTTSQHTFSALCVYEVCEFLFFLFLNSHKRMKPPDSGFLLQTCLSKGGNFYFPPCHIITVSGFRILLDCPLDLSSLMIFSPIPTHAFSNPELPSPDSVDQKRQKHERPIDSSELIRAQPWFKTVTSLHLWNVPFIDVVLISSPMGMLGLPFLSRVNGFRAKIYVTEVTARIGQLLMEDLVLMNKEFRQFYGCEESGLPQWMNWEKLESLPSLFREIVLGEDGVELGGWMPLYSADDVKGCMQKVHTLKYAQEVCYNGTLIIKAVSSGLEIGTYLSSPVLEDVKDNSCYSAPTSQKSSTLSADNDQEASAELLLSTSESLEEMEKLNFICSCIIDSVKAGGSVLIPIGRLGIILQLLELISLSLEASSLKNMLTEIEAVHIVDPSSWVYSFKNYWHSQISYLNGYASSDKKRYGHVPGANPLSSQILGCKNWSEGISIAVWEPCIAFSPHWSLRLGPVVHLLRRWSGDENSLLIMEEGVDADLALLPFKPMAMKDLQWDGLILAAIWMGFDIPGPSREVFRLDDLHSQYFGIDHSLNMRHLMFPGPLLQKVQPLLKILQPKFVLFPEDLRQLVSYSDTNSHAFFYYCENETLPVPSLKNSSELEIAADLVSLIHCRRLTAESIGIGRLKGDFSVTHGKHQLHSGSEQADSSQSRPPLLHWGSLDLERLLAVLEKMGIRGSVEQGNSDTDSENARVVHVYEPNKALIEVRENSTIISASNESLSSLIFEAVDGIFLQFNLKVNLIVAQKKELLASSGELGTNIQPSLHDRISNMLL
ncbi:Integrator complex subunit 9-like [Vitis vinifera]|uniref:Integrator complex subunit 9-like n=1 Tax=Vitis vinifera TaxID=29760 RepID=A0A438CY06_VITVI|nr:Integrator complex subunit 9-like [Vitis vinifera]